MGRCVIFCAGGFQQLALPIEQDDYVLAADGGLVHLQKLGLAPDGIIGDFDSLGYVPQNAQVFPVEKDDTDAMLAVRKGLQLGYREFILYGALDGPHHRQSADPAVFGKPRGKGYPGGPKIPHHHGKGWGLEASQSGKRHCVGVLSGAACHRRDHPGLAV